jgi:ABC-type hemin transport system ATPase subunit
MTSDTLVIYSMNKVGRLVPSTNKQILRDISFGFYYGAKIGVLGLNGAGKSIERYKDTTNPKALKTGRLYRSTHLGTDCS